MRRLWVPFGTCLLLWTLSWNVAVSMGAEPADAVPDSASLVVRWKTPQASLAKLADFVDAVQPGFGEIVNGNLPGMGQAIGNPGLKGVDVEKDIWAIVFAEPQAVPTVVFVLTAKDVDDLKDALPASFHVHAANSLVAYSEDEDALEEVRQRLGGEGKPLLSLVDAATKKLFDGSDVSVLVNVKQVVEDFDEQLKQAGPQLDAVLDAILNTMPDPQRAQLEPVLETYRTIGKAILSGIQDTKSFAMGITFSKSAIRYEDRIQATDGSDTAKFFSRQTPGDLALLGKLPAGKPIYFGMKADVGSMIEWSMNLTKNMMADATDAQKADFDASVKAMGKLKYEEMFMYLDVAAEAPAFRGGSVSVVSPTKSLREISHKLMKSIAELKTPVFTQKSTLEVGVEKIGTAEVDRVTVKQEFDESADPIGAQQKIMTAMFGEAGMQQRILYQANRVLQTTGGGKAELQNLVTALDSTKAPEASMAAARKRFGEKANILVLADLAKVIVSGLRIAAQQEAIPVNADDLAELKLEPSFLGFSLTFEPSAARSQFELPVTQVQNIAKIIPIIQAAH